MGHFGVNTKPQRNRNSFLREDRQRKAAEAKVRQDLAAARPPGEQIRRLNAKLGEGVGAVKERLKLHLRLNPAVEGSSNSQEPRQATKKSRKLRAPTPAP